MKAYFAKRIAVFGLALTFIAVSLSSCKAQERDHLAYQEYPIRAECVLSVGDGDYPLILDITSRENARVTFVGGRLEGSVVEISDPGAYFINAGYRIPLTLTGDSPLSAIVGVFDLSSSDMTKVTQSGQELLISYDCGRFCATVTLYENLPSVIEIVCGQEIYNLAVNKFTSGS